MVLAHLSVVLTGATLRWVFVSDYLVLRKSGW
ncbi:MAG: hypothetical protein QOK27_645 [Gemmatimonadales bacterium]|jgi:hypothetical protein|nr:hypothetical protein [Gemmatimonadales bacterium]